jgi:hypothetical protein
MEKNPKTESANKQPTQEEPMKKTQIQNPTKDDVTAVRMLVRLREDFQAMRKRMDNRIGRKASGDMQDIEERVFRPEDLESFAGFADASRGQEKEVEKALKKVLKRFPIYTEWLLGVKGVGTIAAGWIVGEYDIHKATTVSKLWQFTGLNPSMVVGKKRVENKDGSFSYVPTEKMIRGDKMTPGFVAPFNKRLRVAMVGVLADGFIKAQAPYALNFYYPYKARLEQSDKVTQVMKKGGKVVDMPWSETTKGHRDMAAKRYMIKMFLADLYAKWRELEGLPVREPYQVEHVGHQHKAA